MTAGAERIVAQAKSTLFMSSPPASPLPESPVASSPLSKLPIAKYNLAVMSAAHVSKSSGEVLYMAEKSSGLGNGDNDVLDNNSMLDNNTPTSRPPSTSTSTSVIVLEHSSSAQEELPRPEGEDHSLTGATSASRMTPTLVFI
ncbi:hypothetical protein B0A49_00450 [Cryomyces minteri]|uniref:Uncharacterized protein n=1 Tax=Cryomyces minteri TaxID=331657 RepID=A0A4U0XYP1_9PEZI|nr:hypothetical protein B0A49_00724 [Cryomyces minteri]TKA81693.1 hypothetical protein B0A49_00450 [Cryomyces minteri]